MAYIDTVEIARIFAKLYDPSNSITKLLWKNPEECVRFHFGFVEDNKDPDKKGRLKIRFPHWDESIVSDWAPIIRPFSGTKMGMFFLPEIDEPVMCVFLNDNPSKPFVLGSLRRKGIEKSPVSDTKDNNIKKIVSRSGMYIMLNDKDGSEVLEFGTKDGKVMLRLDTNKGIIIKNEEGDIKIKCKKFKLEAGDNAKIKFEKEMSLKSDSGEIKITSKKDLQLKSGGNVEIKGSTKIKLKGICAANNKAIAKKDDLVVGVDIHQVKVPTPSGTVDVPLPHPYVGKLCDQLSNDVENDNKAVAKKGSKSKYQTPGHIPTPPGVSWSGAAPDNEGEVSSGTEPTVKVNNKEIAVLGSMVKTCNFPQDNETCSIIAAGAVVKIPILIPGVCDPEQNAKDGGMVINVNNLIAPANTPVRNPKFTTVKWSKTKAKVGEEITLEANLSDQYPNAQVDFKIFKDGADVEKDRPVAKVVGQNSGGKAEAKWVYNYIHDPENPLDKKPKFFFQAWSFKCEKKKSSSVEVGADINVEIKNDIGKAMKDIEYKMLQSDGKEKSGKTNKQGKIDEKDAVPGVVKFTFQLDKRNKSENFREVEIKPTENKDKTKIFKIYWKDLEEKKLVLQTSGKYIIVIQREEYIYSI